MDQLPFEVLRHILSFTDLRDRFLLMRVSRLFQAACRSLVAGQRTLFLRFSGYGKHVRMAGQTLSLPLLSSDATSRLWKSWLSASSLVSLTICNHFVKGHELVVSAVVAANAAHLHELRILNENYWNISRLDCLHQVSLPQLRVVTGCHAQDVDFLVTHSPLLQEVSVCDTVSPRDMESLARLTHLKSFQMRGHDSYYDAEAAMWTLLEGASRHVLERICILGTGYRRYPVPVVPVVPLEQASLGSAA